MLRFVPIPKIDPHRLNWTIQHWVGDRYLNFESSLHHTLLLITGNPQAETRVITSFVSHPYSRRFTNSIVCVLFMVRIHSLKWDFRWCWVGRWKAEILTFLGTLGRFPGMLPFCFPWFFLVPVFLPQNHHPIYQGWEILVDGKSCPGGQMLQDYHSNPRDNPHSTMAKRSVFWQKTGRRSHQLTVGVSTKNV